METLRNAFLIAIALLAATASAAVPDPVTTDPPRQEPPASMEGLHFTSAGANLNGVIYEAAGPGPHPTLLLLHGFPGNELNADIAQAVRRAGWNAVIFHYRGAWGSEGEFTFTHVLEDSAAVFAALREPAFAKAHRVDPTRVSLYGHSMGGFAALLTGARTPEARCVASVAGANMGAMAPALADPAAAQQTAAQFQSWAEGFIRDASGETLVKELQTSQGAMDITQGAAALAARPVLLVTGARDDVTPTATNHDPMLAALRKAGSEQLSELRLDSDHAFSDARIALARGVVDFLQQHCR
jgi:pimeloyl-ACP methyl ester carboxylesterase